MNHRVAAARAHARLAFDKAMQRSDAPQDPSAMKGPSMPRYQDSADDEAERIVKQLVKDGECADEPTAWAELMKRRPDLWAKHCQAPLTRITPSAPVTKARPVQPGLLVKADGSEPTFEEQVQYWRERPEEERAYRNSIPRA
jgi:hypothetical protein